MLTLSLIRHGETVAGPGVVAGSTDVALSASGEASVRDLAAGWQVAPSRVLTSPLARAQQTAAILNARWSAQQQVDERLKEMDFGEWEGLLWDDVSEHDAARFEQWSSNWVREPVPGGESLLDLSARCESFLKEAIRRLDSEHVAVIAHAGSIRVLVCLALGLPLDSAMRFSVDYASVSRIVVSEHSARCHFINAESIPKREQPSNPASQ